MTVYRTISENFSVLRAFSSAACGSARSGDAHLSAAIETIVHDNHVLPPASSSKISVFKFVTRIILSTSICIPRFSDNTTSNIPEYDLLAISPEARVALLLIHGARFTTHQAAEILGITDVQLSDLANVASDQLARQHDVEPYPELHLVENRVRDANCGASIVEAAPKTAAV